MTQSNTDWIRLASGTQGEPIEEHPEAEVRHVVCGIVRQGLKPLPTKADAGNTVPSVTRQAGLHVGCAVMADDFDAPLSDNFWLVVE